MKKRTSLLTIAALAVVVGLLTGCASSMMIATKRIEPGPDFAVVNFIRPSIFGGAIKFGVWDRDTLVGVLTPNCCIQYKAGPGDHIFMIRAENWGVVKATVAAGKTYTIIAEPRMGLMKAQVNMEVIKPKDKRLKGWMKDVDYVTIDPKDRDAYAKDRAKDARAATKNVEAGKANIDATMSPDDGA
jgi:hypothetical protein